MSFGRIQHLHSEVIVREAQALSLLPMLVPGNLSVIVSEDSLHGGAWFQGCSIDEALVLVGGDHDGRGQLLLILSSRTSISQRTQVVLTLNRGSFPLNSISDLRGVPDANVCRVAEGVLLLKKGVVRSKQRGERLT